MQLSCKIGVQYQKSFIKTLTIFGLKGPFLTRLPAVQLVLKSKKIDVPYYVVRCRLVVKMSRRHNFDVIRQNLVRFKILTTAIKICGQTTNICQQK